MDFKELMTNRKSTRNYKDIPVSIEKLKSLEEYFYNCERLIPDIKTEVLLFENGNIVFDKLDNIAGYKGRMIEAPHYFIILSENKSGCFENTGYIGESMILKAVENGVDTCWITFSESDKIKDALNIDSKEEVTGIISAGYDINIKKIVNTIKTGGNYSRADMAVREDNTSFRYSPEQIVYLREWGNKVELEDLERRGFSEAFHYTRLAPSTLNQQPWRFILDDDKLVLTIKDNKEIEDKNEKIDAGIVMLYFDIVISNTIYDLKWNLGKPEKEYEIPDDFKIVSWCRI